MEIAPALAPALDAGLLSAALQGRVHMVGIGGAGMSAIARVLKEAGGRVSGSDLRDSSVLESLRALQVPVEIGHHPVHVAGAALVVASTAVPADNVELLAARDARIPILHRGEALARLVEDHRLIGVAGTHGKTTTSGMIATVLEVAGWNPTWLIGADLIGGGPGGKLGGDLAVVEADEAYGSFLWLHPHLAVITNIEEDHLDHYGSMEALEAAFVRFLSQTKGPRVLCLDDERVASLRSLVSGDLTYGFAEEAMVRAESMEGSASGSRFELALQGRRAGRIELRIAGRHNVQNALGAVAACTALGLAPEAIAEGLGAYAGARRRFEYRGKVAGADVVDDYAHHPTEIAATIEAARWGPWTRVVAVFQPHLYSRTQALWREFGAALAQADVVVITDVYPAREAPVPGVSGMLIVRAVCEAAPGRRVAYLPRLEEATRFVRSQLEPGDLLLTLGAGDITTLTDALMRMEAKENGG
ncbi:MAG: UDP-N-acetylmuramate--L-alanine ligase [Actinomycetota bacterium]